MTLGTPALIKARDKPITPSLLSLPRPVLQALIATAKAVAISLLGMAIQRLATLIDFARNPVLDGRSTFTYFWGWGAYAVGSGGQSEALRYQTDRQTAKGLNPWLIAKLI